MWFAAADGPLLYHMCYWLKHQKEITWTGQVSCCQTEASAAERVRSSASQTVFIVNLKYLNRDYNPLFSFVTHSPPGRREKFSSIHWKQMEAKKDGCFRWAVTVMLMSCKWMTDGEWARNQCYIGVSVILCVRHCLAPLRHCSGAGAILAPLQLLVPLDTPAGPCVSECYCSHCTHRLLHLHVAHRGVWGGFRPVRQLLVAASLGIQ